MPLPRAIMEKAVASPSTTGFEREHKHSQYREIGPRRASIELWRRGETDRELHATDRVMTDTAQATAKITGQEEEMTFHINPGTLSTISWRVWLGTEPESWVGCEWVVFAYSVA